MATSAATGPVAEVNGSSQKLPPPGQQQSRPSFAAKVPEGTRRPDDDASQRRAPHPKAWTSGVNPITQRSNSSSQMNGTNSRSFNPSAGDRASADRQAWVYGNSVGLECSITTKTGEMFTGVLAGARKSGDDHKVTFKMARELRPSNHDGASSSPGEYCGSGPDHVMVFPASLLQLIEVPEPPVSSRAGPANGASGFRTDTDISGNLAMRERNLQRWEAPSTKGVDMSLDSNSGGWDQFKANEQQFGLKTDYDENIYTTTINKQSPLYAMRAREAERIAREIEAGTSTNAHVREERGVNDEAVDEEEKYSGVRRDYQSLQSNQPGRYIPPSRRGPASTETNNSGGPIDPAIISSQKARPEQKEVKEQPKELPKEQPKAASKELPSPAGPPVQPLDTTAVPAIKETRSIRQQAKPGVLATDNVEMDVLDSFRQFAANEKIKVQDHKRTRASADKAVKLNDLMKFSKNFKLLTPVPKDLVPILAKDENKQKEIVQKAERNAETSSPAKAAPLVDQKSSRPLAAARWEAENTVPGSDPNGRDRNRQSSATQASSLLQKERVPSRDQGQQARLPSSATLSAKLTDHHRAHKAGISANIPPVLPIQETRNTTRNYPPAMSSPQKSSGSRGPLSATSAKFNAKAMEFKPTAPAFKPASVSGTTAVSSPRSGSVTRNISPAGAPAKFFGDRVSFGNPSERLNPHTVVMQKPAEEPAVTSADGSIKPAAPALPAANGGFQWPYKTAPTWVVGDDILQAPDYKESFKELRSKRRSTPQPHASPGSTMHNQYPPPSHSMQQVPHGGSHPQPPHHASHQMHNQPHHYNHGPHYEDNHMRPSASNSSSFPAPSPRVQHQNMVYHSPMPAQAQLAYPQHMQYPMQTPPMGARQFSNGPHMVPMQGAHLAPMMVQQHSSGGYMPQHVPMAYNGQMPMFPGPGPNPQMYGSPGQPPSGYPSPGRGAPMMMHQGSQQGQQPVYLPPGQYGQPVYAQQPAHMPMRPNYGSPQPHFAQNAYPQHHYPHQVHRTPSSGYAQPNQGHHQNGHAQPGTAQPTGSSEIVDEAK